MCWKGCKLRSLIIILSSLISQKLTNEVDQLYVVFVLADGGKDLEYFVLSDFDEARSLLLQVVDLLLTKVDFPRRHEIFLQSMRRK